MSPLVRRIKKTNHFWGNDMFDVLKRFWLTALGAMGTLSALGLGALMPGPAVAQQIPAPDAYGEITDCTTTALDPVNRPFGMGTYEDKSSILDVIFRNALGRFTPKFRLTSDDGDPATVDPSGSG